MNHDRPILNSIEAQYQELLAMPNLSREECMKRYPDLVAYVLNNISLVDLLKSQGIEVKHLSPDAPGIYIAEGGCPDCGSNIIVKE